MERKFLEIRDDGTFIPAMAMTLSGDDSWLARRAGYGRQNYILLMKLNGPEIQYNWSKWPSAGRTMRIAHRYINENWDSIVDGQIIDVQFIEKETTTPCESEQTLRHDGYD